MDRLSKGIRILSRIRRLAEIELNEREFGRFLHQAFRYSNVKLSVYPGTKPQGPGDLLNEIIEKQVFDSKF